MTTLDGRRRHHDVGRLCLGAMNFGTAVDRPTSFALLDRFLARGGTFIDTANNYAGWRAGDAGGQSETLLGEWLTAHGCRDEIVLATKGGARRDESGQMEGLATSAVEKALSASLERLRCDAVDIYYAHVDDYAIDPEEYLEAYARLVEQGRVDVLGASNFWSWKVERCRALSRTHDWPQFQVLQYHHTYFRSRVDLPGPRAPEGEEGIAAGDILAYARLEPGLVLCAYSPLLGGGYVHPDRLDAGHAHDGTAARREALDEVAREVDATVNQVVVAWLCGATTPWIPIVGPSSLGQLDELMDALDLQLSPEQRSRLDLAGVER